MTKPASVAVTIKLNRLPALVFNTSEDAAADVATSAAEIWIVDHGAVDCETASGFEYETGPAHLEP
jgi:hypothetical protein